MKLLTLAFSCLVVTACSGGGAASSSGAEPAGAAGSANLAGSAGATTAGEGSGGAVAGQAGSAFLGAGTANTSGAPSGGALANGGVGGSDAAAGSAGQAVAGTGGTASAPDRVLILTYNDRTATADAADAKLGNDWAHRLPLVKQLFSDLRPDVVGIQEATDKQVADMTPGFEVARESELALLYAPDRLELMNHGSLKLGVFGNPDPWGDRYTLWGQFRTKPGNRVFFAYVTHLSTAGDNVPQSKQVFDAAAKSAQDGTPTVVLGDFNYDAGANLLKSGHTDAVTDHLGTFHAFAGGRSGPRFDFIGTLHWPSVDSAVDTRADTSKSQAVYPSDHYPVWSRLQLGG